MLFHNNILLNIIIFSNNYYIVKNDQIFWSFEFFIFFIRNIKNIHLIDFKFVYMSYILNVKFNFFY